MHDLLSAWCICIFMTKPSVHRSCVPWFSMMLRDWHNLWSLKFTPLHHLPSVMLLTFWLQPQEHLLTNKRQKNLRHKKKLCLPVWWLKVFWLDMLVKLPATRWVVDFFRFSHFWKAPMDFRVPPGYYTNTSVQDEGCKHNQAHSSKHVVFWS